MRTALETGIVACIVLTGLLITPSAAAVDETTDGCEATIATPVCNFECDASSLIKMTFYGEGYDYYDGSMSCTGSGGFGGVEYGYVSATSVRCHPPDPNATGLYRTLEESLYEVAYSNECSSTSTFFQVEGVGQGTCILERGASLVCESVQVVPT
jgi:hypothetical protein